MGVDQATDRGFFVRARSRLPRGSTLPADAWARRHRWMIVILALHAAGLPIFALIMGYAPGHALLHGAPMAAAALFGARCANRRLASASVVLGLLTASAMAVHSSGGHIEAHFHFFVMIVIIVTYEDWMPFLLAIGYVVLHHGATSLVDAHGVYNHADAVAHPWKWAAIHGAFVLAASAGAVASWRLNEDVRDGAMSAAARTEADALRRAMQQSNVAELGSLALGGLALHDLFREAVARLALSLDAEMASLHALSPESHAFVAVAGVGWEGQPASIPTDGTQLGFTLRSPEPVVIDAVENEARFDPSRLLAAGIVTGMSTVVADRGGETFGVLSVHSRARRTFSADDVHLLQTVAGVLGSAVQRHRSEDDLRHQALHDPLTSLPNRVLFLDRLAHALVRSERSAAPLAVMFIDLDEFKMINDSLGHQAGDRLLQGLAPRLASALRVNDTLARFGGDEFVVLCEDLTDSAEAMTIADRLRDAFDSPFQIGDHEHFVSASIGIVVSSSAYHGRPDALVRDADAAMYRAKAGGRDRTELFDETMRKRILNRLEIEQGLRRALREGELRVHYQPLVDLVTERVLHCEALVRWERPRVGLVPPAEFIPIAEESGLIIEIGQWVLQTACRQAAEWHADTARPDLAEVQIAVNLSAVQVAQPDIVDTVAATLRRTGLAAERLTLEITETALVEDPEGAARVLGALRELGVQVALDDFGTGFSSLSAIKRYPLTSIKLDRSFIAGVAEGTKDAAIIASLVSMAHALSLETVAEGVETDQQRSWLRSIGCDVAQGYLFSRPVSADEFQAAFDTRLAAGF